MPLALVAVPAGAQAHSPTCPGTGTDSAVSSPVVIDASIACPDGAPALSVVYALSVDGIVSLDDKAPTGGTPSDHDDLRFTPITPTGSTPSHVVFGNQTYTLKNVHYHGLAEHKFASQPGFSPLEAHLVHELDGPALGYVVLSVLLNTGDNGWSEHDHLLHEPPSTVGATKNVFAVNLQALLPPPGSRSYYRYTGSLHHPGRKPRVLQAGELDRLQPVRHRDLVPHQWCPRPVGSQR